MTVATETDSKEAKRIKALARLERAKREARELERSERPAPELLIKKASEVPYEKLSFLFGGRLIRGVFQLMIGPGEAGKGMGSTDTISRLSTGAPFPGDEDKKARDPMNVAVCVTEDSAPRVKARLTAADADLDKVLFVDGPPQRRGGLTLPSPVSFDDDAGALLKVVKQHKVGAMFLETTVEHLGDREGSRKWSTNNEAEVRRALSPIVAVCREGGIIGWGVMHPRKSMDGALDDAISGSAAFRNVARSILYVYKDPVDDSKNPTRLLCSNKSNHLQFRPTTLRFRIEPWEKDPTEGHIVWGIEGRTLEDPRTSEEIWEQFRQKRRPRRDRRVQEAEAFLRTCLSDGVSNPDAIRKASREEGLSWTAVKDAKVNLRIVSVKEGFPAKVIKWDFEKKEF